MKRKLYIILGWLCGFGVLGTAGASDIGNISFGQMAVQLTAFMFGVVWCYYRWKDEEDRDDPET